MEASTMLLLSILLPLAGAILIASIGAENRVIVRRLALIVSTVNLLLAVAVIAQYDSAGDSYMRTQMSAAAAGVEPSEAFRPEDTAFAVTAQSRATIPSGAIKMRCPPSFHTATAIPRDFHSTRKPVIFGPLNTARSAAMKSI